MYNPNDKMSTSSAHADGEKKKFVGAKLNHYVFTTRRKRKDRDQAEEKAGTKRREYRRGKSTQDDVWVETKGAEEQNELHTTFMTRNL